MTNNNIKYEEEILKFWDEKDIYNKVKKRNQGSKIFTFVEGPPYPTGDAHLGHIRNWAIKDSVFRFKRAMGLDVYARDGYDVHGLPVEQKVQNKLGIKDTKELREDFGIDKFILECRKFVNTTIDDMKSVRKRTGLWVDTDHWMTSHPRYISNAWKFFKEANKKNMLYKDFKCVAWSPALETTLSDYEVKDSYAQLEDPSVYVRFKVKKDDTTTDHDEYLLIWTTTPWTLEANQAIAVNKDFEYAKVLVEDESESYVLIVGLALVEQVIEKLKKSQKIKSHKVIETVIGHRLVGIRYEHVYPENLTQRALAQIDTQHRVLHADFVSLGEGESHLEKLGKKSYKHDGPKTDSDIQEKQKKVVKDGTGVAHEAPAHGMDDFELCRAEGLSDIYCIVDEKGNMIEESMFRGMNFRDANKEVIKHLTKTKAMLHSEMKVHTYPLCWRSKVPIVYRTTTQWYVKRSEYTKDIIEANKGVQWFPDFAKTAFNNLMSNAGDWAISRQRFWGTPLPVFEDEEGNFEVFGSKEELESKIGKTLPDIHLDDLAKVSYKSKEGKEMKHCGFTVDVWFDSGAAAISCHYPESEDQEAMIKKHYPNFLDN